MVCEGEMGENLLCCDGFEDNDMGSVGGFDGVDRVGVDEPFELYLVQRSIDEGTGHQNEKGED